MYSQALKLLREYHRMSQTDLAPKIGISKSYISEVESGYKVPGIALIERYANFFEIPLSMAILFAEQLGNKEVSKEARSRATGKVRVMLDWVEETSRFAPLDEALTSSETGLPSLNNRTSSRPRKPRPRPEPPQPPQPQPQSSES